MKNNPIDKLLLSPISWLANSGPDEDIVISSRIRLARNLSGLPFPVNSSESEHSQVLSILSAIINKHKILDGVMELNINSLSELDRLFLLERHLISREFCKGGTGCSLMVNETGFCSLMINEEDHIRLQVIQPGLSLRKIWNVIDGIDNNLSSNVSFAYNNTLLDIMSN